MSFDAVAGKVGQAAIALSRGIRVIDQVLDMDRTQPARFRDAEQLTRHEAIGLLKRFIVFHVAHVTGTFGIDVEIGEGRRENAEINAVVWQLRQHLDTVGIPQRPIGPFSHIDAGNLSHDTIQAGRPDLLFGSYAW